ncbi:MAG: hypothetical protein KAQ67_13050, partial [Gammaproteobacteria bacterium]|nr:hypothetical protein [Gammaproteobacteria bacterium]
MSNPEKEHFDELNVSNNLSDTVEYGDTAYTAEAGTGYALSFAYMFPGKWMIEAETYSASDSNMTRSGTSFGAGMYTNTDDSLSWYSLGAGSETASWDDVSV